MDSEATGAAALCLPHTVQLHGSSPLKKVANCGGLLPLRLVFAVFTKAVPVSTLGSSSSTPQCAISRNAYAYLLSHELSRMFTKSSTIHSSPNWKLPKCPSVIE